MKDINLDMEISVQKDMEQLNSLQTMLYNMKNVKNRRKSVDTQSRFIAYLNNVINVLFSLQNIMIRLTLNILSNNFEPFSQLKDQIQNIMKNDKLTPPKKKKRQGAFSNLRTRLDEIYKSMDIQLRLMKEYVNKMLKVSDFTVAYDSRLKNVESELMLFIEKQKELISHEEAQKELISHEEAKRMLNEPTIEFEDERSSSASSASSASSSSSSFCTAVKEKASKSTRTIH